MKKLPTMFRRIGMTWTGIGEIMPAKLKAKMRQEKKVQDWQDYCEYCEDW